jgi:hypothetical protein
MDSLNVYAAIAEIFGGLALLLGGGFALVQLSEFRRQRKGQIAADLCRAFSQAALGKAVVLIKRLPDGITVAELQAMDLEYEESAQIMLMAFETMGLLVFRDIASFRMIQELTGGLLLMLWRKLAVYVAETREAHGNPRFAEWVQWLVERIAEREGDMVPAYLEHARWRRSN